MSRYHDTLLTDEQLIKHMSNLCYGYSECLPNETDNLGQYVIYTGVWKWEDGTLHNEPEIE